MKQRFFPILRSIARIPPGSEATGVFFMFLFMCLSLCLCLLSRHASADEPFPWPIRSPKSISSTFGEPRPGRFHLGLDFKSGGAVGKKVLALGDGYILRVRTSPFGYGKGLYVKLDSGETIVYGHLSGYMPEIEDILFKKRIEKGSYDIDWYPKPNSIRTEPGQVIAYSGDTGSGPAHLHVEIRDNNNIPQNPLRYGFEVRDRIAPIIESALLMPFDRASSVDGLPDAQWCDFSSDIEPFILTGAVGVAISTYDKTNLAPNRLGVYRLSLAVDSTVVFTKTYDDISYDDMHYGAFDNLPGRRNGGSGYLSVLFRRTGNALDIYEGDGVLTAEKLASGVVHTITVRASDFAGNTTERSFPVMFGSRPFLTACELTGGGSLRIAGRHVAGALDAAEIWTGDGEMDWTLLERIDIDGGGCDITTDLEAGPDDLIRIVLSSGDGLFSSPLFLRCGDAPESSESPCTIDISTDLRHDSIVAYIRSSAPLASLPIVRIERDGVMNDGIISPVAIDACTWVTSFGIPRTGAGTMRITASAVDAALAPVEGLAEIVFSAVDGKSRDTVLSPDGRFTLTVPEGALYRPAPVAVDTVNAHRSNGLRPVSNGYKVVWGDFPLKSACETALTLDNDPPEKAAMYVSGNGNGWSFVSAKKDGRTFTGTMGGSGHVAILVDNYAPYLAAALPRPGTTVASRTPLLRARIEDKGSGLDGSDSIEMYIDGIRVYGEYDYEADRVSYRLRNPLKSGKHTVRVKATDRMGNEKQISWNFRVQ